MTFEAMFQSLLEHLRAKRAARLASRAYRSAVAESSQSRFRKYHYRKKAKRG